MNREEAVKRAAALVEQMTVEEMASQLRFPGHLGGGPGQV